MARRITTVSTATQQKTINPYSQPCFTTYALNHSHGGGYHCYDHNMNIVSHTHGTGSSSYGEFRTHTTSATEFFESSNSYDSTQTNDSAHTRSGWHATFTHNVGYLGHVGHMGNGGRSGNVGGWVAAGRNNGSSYSSYAFRDCCAIVNERNQDYAIFMLHHGQDQAELMVGQRSATTYWHLRHQTQRTNRARIPHTWEDSNGADNYNDSYRSLYGAGCYNAKTEKFVVIYGNPGNNGMWKPIVYNNCPNLRKIANDSEIFSTDAITGRGWNDSSNILHTYFQDKSNATQYDMPSWSGYNNLSGHDEARYRNTPVMCDNGKVVVMTMIPHWGSILQRWNADGTYESGNDYTYGMSWTTSYGIEQGHHYGGRWQCSSDGRYLWHYCPSYYYGCGAYLYCVRVADGKFLRFQTNDSNYSRQPFPWGKSGIGWFKGENTDGGNGHWIGLLELDYYFAYKNDGEEIPMDGHFHRYHFEPGTYSTAYGCIIPCMYDTSLFTDDINAPKLPF